MDVEVQDANGLTLAVGDRVQCGDPDVWGVEGTQGTITGISEPDGDVNDEGRTIGINPRVSVRFDDEDEDSFPASPKIRGWVDYMLDVPYVCEDVVKFDVNAYMDGTGPWAEK